MLLKRIAKNNLRYKIAALVNYEKKSKSVATKAFKSKSKSKKELLADLTFYTQYCIDKTVNADEEYLKKLKKLFAICKKKNLKALRDFCQP